MLSQSKLRPAEPGDFEAMMAVWHAAFGPGFQGGAPIGAETMRWLLSDAWQAPEGRPWGWVAEENGRIIAAWLSLPVELALHGQRRAAHWLMSTAVAPEGQKKGLGRALYRRILAEGTLTLGVGVVPASRALYAKEGAAFVGADVFGQRFTRPLRTLRYGLGRLGRGQLREGLSLFANLTRQLTHRAPAGILVEEATHIPPEIDALLDRVGAQIPVMVRRDRRWLERAVANPRCRVRLCTARRGADLCGYALLRDDGMILDLLAPPDDTAALRALALHMIAWARSQRIEELTALMTQHPAFRAIYDWAGFIPRHDFGLFFAPTGEAELEDVLNTPENWYVSMADSDLWSFRLKA